MAEVEQATKRIKYDDKSGPEIQELKSYSQPINADLLKEANEALQESNRLHVRPIVDETQLGVELFVGDKRDEFHGLIKTRYADFIVHEIDSEGNVAHLTSLEAPEEEDPNTAVNLSDFVDPKALESISEVNNGYLNEYKIDVTGMDKDTRTSLHHAIRATFDRLESSTLSDADKNSNGSGKNDKEKTKAKSAQQVARDESRVEDKKYILITRRSKVSRPKNIWPRDRPDHTHFLLYKENKDTMDAIHNLAAAINTRPSNFSYAGVKDRRAVTTQWLSSWRLEPRRLIAASRRFNKRPFIKVGNFCYKKEPLRLGNLKANKFNIVIRHLVYNNDGQSVIEKAVKCIKEKGFVNYFGLQRFGTRSIQTHEIGLAILQANWEKAVDLILSYRFDDNMQPPSKREPKSEPAALDSDTSNLSNPEIQKSHRHKHESSKWTSGSEQHNSFIDLWKSKLDAEIVFKKYPHYRFSNEGMIMKSLSKSEESSRDYFSALIALPRNTRSLYVHSYQSLLWNKVTTYRLRKYGFKVVVGDLILSSDMNISDNSLDILLSTDPMDTSEEANTKNGSPEVCEDRKVPVEELDKKIVVATEENKDQYTIFDVVLPIVGSRVRLPTNDVGQEIQRLLGLDQLTLESFKAREKLFISYGSYRKIMVKPQNVDWRIKQYSNPQKNLIETDLEVLNRESLAKESETNEKSTISPKSDSTDEALLIEFELPPSSYATMCLREIMKKPSTDFNSKF